MGARACDVHEFAKKTFTNWLRSTKFVKVFSLESFPLYGSPTRNNKEDKINITTSDAQIKV